MIASVFIGYCNVSILEKFHPRNRANFRKSHHYLTFACLNFVIQPFQIIMNISYYLISMTLLIMPRNVVDFCINPVSKWAIIMIQHNDDDSNSSSDLTALSVESCMILKAVENQSSTKMIELNILIMKFSDNFSLEHRLHKICNSFTIKENLFGLNLLRSSILNSMHIKLILLKH